MAIPFSFSQKRNFSLPYPEDFTIFVDEKQYLFYSEKLAVFSPKMNQLFLCDPTLKSIQFPYNDDKEQFSCIKILVNGGEITVNTENYDFLSKAATFFENESLLSATSFFLIFSSDSTIFTRLNDQPIKYIHNELEYIAEKFQSFITNDKICSLPLEYYDIIFNSPSFNFSDEHQLFKWVTKMVEIHDANFISLYSHINFDNLTPEEVQTFLNHADITKLSGSLLYSVKSRLTKVTPKNEDVNIEYTDKVIDVPPYLQIQSKEFPYIKSNDDQCHFNGIFNFISKNGNPQYRGYITMSTPSIFKKKKLNKLIDYNEQSDFNWNNYNGDSFRKEDQFIIIRFFIYKVRLDAYTIFVNKEKPNYSQMKHWKVFGSKNGIDWYLIDEEDTDVLNKPQSLSTFKCNKGDKDFYNYFKIEQLENFSRKEAAYEMTLSKIEFFGEVRKL